MTGLFEYVQDKYSSIDLLLETQSLQRLHWYQLWRIFENYVERPQLNSKEYLESLNTASYEGEEVILNAHNTNYNELDWQLKMEHYMNSRQYH
jgi:hypothetical protein